MRTYSFYDRKDGPQRIQVWAENYDKAAEIARQELGYVPAWYKVAEAR
jgi:hypothetical protein